MLFKNEPTFHIVKRVKKRLNFFGQKLYEPRDILDDKETVSVVKDLLNNFFAILMRRDYDSSEHLVREIFTKINCLNDIHELELKLRYLIDSRTEYGLRQKAIVKRCKSITEQIFAYIAGSKVLDIGCGNGLISNGIKKKGSMEITLADVKKYVYPEVDLPFVLINPHNNKLPFEDSSFDTVLLLTVLHHSDNPISLFHEASRVTKYRLIIIESLYGIKESQIDSTLWLLTKMKEDQIGLRSFLTLSYEQQRLYASFMDWFYNRILEGDVSVPDNFATHSEWLKIFSESKLCVLNYYFLGIDQSTAPEFHVLYILSPKLSLHRSFYPIVGYF